jgi:hypothetical protein
MPLRGVSFKPQRKRRFQRLVQFIPAWRAPRMNRAARLALEAYIAEDAKIGGLAA